MVFWKRKKNALHCQTLGEVDCLQNGVKLEVQEHYCANTKMTKTKQQRLKMFKIYFKYECGIYQETLPLSVCVTEALTKVPFYELCCCLIEFDSDVSTTAWTVLYIKPFFFPFTSCYCEYACPCAVGVLQNKCFFALFVNT